MSDPWYPVAVHDPGIAANYAHGRNAMVSVVCHYTVGVDSRALLRDGGLCQFLVSRDGTVWQFSEVDAVCWHAGQPYNSRGPGIEVEWYEPHDGPDIFTPEAEKASGALVSWLHDEHGISLDYKADEPRVADWVGFIAHRAVIEDADLHSDYWPHLPVAPPVTPRKRAPDVTVMWIQFNGINAYLVQGGIIVHQFHGTPNAFGIPQDASDFAEGTNCGIVGMTGGEWSALLKRSGVLA